MTDTATSRFGARQQSQGSNVNSWGDDKLNEVLRLFDRGAKGVQSLAMTGSTTLSWTNYVATNDGQCSVLLLTGSLSSAANLVVPSVEWQWDLIKNSTGQTVTVKTSAGTGVAIPNGRQASVFCDASDCYFGVPNYIGTDITEANSRDLMDKGAVETAIATASLPATSGTILNSVADDTAGYLNQKVTVSISTATTTQLGSLLSVQLSTENAGSNEKLKTTFSAPYIGGFIDGGLQSTGFTPVVGYAYDVDCTSATVTAHLGSMTSVQIGHEIKINNFGNFPMLLKGTVNGQTDFTVEQPETRILRYSGASWGWN